MRLREGFVSNSSSSSFILRKDILSEENIAEVRDFVKKYDSYLDTRIHEEDLYFHGDLEAHTSVDESDNTPANKFRNLVESFSVGIDMRYYYDCEYSGSPELMDTEHSPDLDVEYINVLDGTSSLSDSAKKWLIKLKHNNAVDFVFKK